VRLTSSGVKIDELPGYKPAGRQTVETPQPSYWRGQRLLERLDESLGGAGLQLDRPGRLGGLRAG